MPAVYRASLAQAPLPWLPVGLVDEPGGISLHPEPGWARADQVGPWLDLSDEDTPEESHLSLCDPPPRMLPPPTSFRSGWPSGGDRPCGGNFFFSISPPPRKLPQGTQVTARTEPSAGQLAALGPVAEVVVPASPPRGGGHPEMYADQGDSGLRGQPLLDRADRWRPLPTTRAPLSPGVFIFLDTFPWGHIFQSFN